VVARFAGRRVAVLGDLMLDRYLWGGSSGSRRAPVPVVEIERETASLGGAGNVAANLSALGAVPVLLGVAGGDAAGAELRARLAEHGVDAGGVLADAGRPTTVKTRIIAHSQQVVRATGSRAPTSPARSSSASGRRSCASCRAATPWW